MLSMISLQYIHPSDSHKLEAELVCVDEAAAMVMALL